MISDSLPPKPVRAAVTGIFVLVAVSYVDAIWAVFSSHFRGQLDTVLCRSSPTSLSNAAVEEARTAVLVGILVGAAVWSLVLVWLGFKLRRGKRWARIVVTVILGHGVFTALWAQVNPDLASDRWWVELLDLGYLLLQVGVLALLWSPEGSRCYFRRREPMVAMV